MRNLRYIFFPEDEMVGLNYKCNMDQLQELINLFPRSVIIAESQRL